MKGDHSMLRSRGISVPLTAILLTVAIIAITSAVVTGAMAYVSAAGGELREASSSPVLLLHEAIETVCLSNAGTSTTIILKNDRGPITSAPTNDTTTVSFPVQLLVATLEGGLPDPAGIVSSVEVSSALSLNGVDAYVRIPAPDDNPLNFHGGDFGWGGWFNITRPSPYGCSILGAYPHDGCPGNLVMGIHDDKMGIFLSHRNTTGASYTYSFDYTPYFGKETFVFWTKSSEEVRLYINGELKATWAPHIEFDVNYHEDAIWIGVGIWHPGVMPMAADDVLVYNRALNGTEVSYLYQYRVPMNSSGLVGWWRFDEGVPGTAIDSSGMGNNCTDYNSARALFGPSEVTYNMKMNQFTIPAGTCRVTVSKNTDGSLELEVVAG
jgi:hypothetical protein